MLTHPTPDRLRQLRLSAFADARQQQQQDPTVAALPQGLPEFMPPGHQGGVPYLAHLLPPLIPHPLRIDFCHALPLLAARVRARRDLVHPVYGA